MGPIRYPVAPASRSGWVYVLTNPAMHGLVKIGCTGRTPEDRARELSGATGVPAPFVVAWAWPVSDWHTVEGLTHDKLGLCRPNGNREFFACSPRKARRAIRRAARAYMRPTWLRLLIGPRRRTASLPFAPRWKRPARAGMLGPVLVVLSLAVLVERIKPAVPLWLPTPARATILLLERF